MITYRMKIYIITETVNYCPIPETEHVYAFTSDEDASLKFQNLCEQYMMDSSFDLIEKNEDYAVFQGEFYKTVLQLFKEELVNKNNYINIK